jgi:hypothetical protein
MMGTIASGEAQPIQHSGEPDLVLIRPDRARAAALRKAAN